MKASLDVRTLSCQHTIFSPKIHSPIRTVLIAHPFFFHYNFMDDMSLWKLNSSCRMIDVVLVLTSNKL
jgi:hypothetical protein